MTSLRLPKLAYYRTVLCTFLRFGTMTWPSIRFDISSKNEKKPLDIIWPQIERKCSEEYLAIILAVKRKLWAIFLPRFHLEKEQTPGGKLKTFYIGNLSLCLHDSGFLDTSISILVFVNGNCCLCKCFSKLCILLMVSSLSCHFNRCAGCFRS